MKITFATQAAPGVGNEDYVVAGPNWAIVLDGATAPSGVDSGCIHNVAWLVHRLASALSSRLVSDDRSLPDILAESIKEVCGAHTDTCDLGNPDSPSSTVAIVRHRDDALECLALADSPIAVQHLDGAVSLVEDDRTAHLPGGRPYSIELVRSCRNQPDGFWVASTNPSAAYEAVTATFVGNDVLTVAMLTDGVTRLIDHFGHNWPGLLSILENDGPGRAIEAVREAERARPGTFSKPHDDATALVITEVSDK